MVLIARSRLHIGVSVAVLAGFVLALAAPAGAAQAWLAPSDLSAPSHDAVKPQVSRDALGDTAVVWQRSDGANQVIEAAVRPAGGAWEAAQQLSSAGRDAYNPHVATGPKGDVVAVWRRDDGSNDIVQAAARPAGGGWQAPVDLSAVGHDADNPRVAFDAQGTAIAVWVRTNGTDWLVQAAVMAAGTGAWQAPVDVSTVGGEAHDPRIAIDAAGNAVVVWYRSSGAGSVVQAAVRPALSGIWQAPVDVSVSASGATAWNPAVAVDPRGDTVSTWVRFDGSNYVTQAAVRPAGGVWQAPVNLSAAGRDATDATVAFDAGGNAVAAWERSNGTNTIVESAVRPATTGTWELPATDLSAAGGNAFTVQVAIDPSGNVLAVWTRSNGTVATVQGASRPATIGAWQAPAEVSAAGRNAISPQLAFDGQGNAVAAWSGYDGTRHSDRFTPRTSRPALPAPRSPTVTRGQPRCGPPRCSHR